MGFQTEIVIWNDALHKFEANPKAFGEAILKGIREANHNNRQTSIPFDNYCGYLAVEPSRHADHEAIFIHSGNSFTVIGAFENDWTALIKRNPELAQDLVKKAKRMLSSAEKQLKHVVNENKKAKRIDQSTKNSKELL